MKGRNKIRRIRGKERIINPPYEDTYRKTEAKDWDGICIANGDENDYSEKIENYIENSINATTTSNLFKRFLVGQGDLNYNDWQVNKKQKFDEFIDDLADEYKDHRGFYVLVKPNALGEPKEYKQIPFTNVRIKDVDSNGNITKFLVSQNWQDHRDWIDEKKDNEKYEFLPFSPNTEVTRKQIENAGGLEKFKGSIFYFNGGKAKYNYPLAFIHSVINDCDSDFRIQMHRNKRVRGGILNKKIIITPPQMPKHLDLPDDQLDDSSLELKRKIENEIGIAEQMKNFVGAENNDGFLHLEMEFDQDDIDKLVKIIDIESISEDGYFEKNEEQIATNLKRAYFNPPPILLESDNSFFGSSGEAIREAMEFYDKNVMHERFKFERSLKNLFDKDIKLVSLLENTANTVTEDD